MTDTTATSDIALGGEVDPRTYLVPILQRWWLILAIVIAGTSLGYYYEARKPEVFQSSTALFLQASDADSVLATTTQIVVASGRTVSNQAVLLKSHAVAVLVKNALHYPGPADALRGRVSVTPSTDADVLTITATGPTGKAAADLANAYADAFIAARQRDTNSRLFRARQATGDELAGVTGGGPAVEQQRADLRQKIRQLKSVQKTAQGGVTQIDSAEPGGPVGHNPKKTAIFGFFLSLLAGVMLALFLERLDRRCRTPDEISETYQVPLLSVLPHARNPHPIENGTPVFADDIREAARSLRVNIGLQTLDAKRNAIVVTSAVPGEGKSTVARNLALAFAESGSRTVLVSADLRKPVVADRMGLAHDLPGLTDLLGSPGGLEEGLVTVIDEPRLGGMLRVLPAGAPVANPPAILGSQRMAEAIDKLATDYDVVILDCPPLLAVSDTLSLLRACDAVLFVGRIGLTDRKAVKRLRDVVSRVEGVNPIGVVANDVPASSSGYGYGYGYGYGAGMAEYTDAPAKDQTPTAAT